jgi:hypothetical protein
MKNNELLNELIKKQLKSVPNDKKLRYNDLKRLCKYLNSSIFDEDICSLWTGYITNINNVSKGVYINFYFKGKKTALHRLLYANFVGDLSDDEYLKFSCENKGKCCNLAHLKKFNYNKPCDNSESKTKETSTKNEINDNTIKKEVSFTLTFD